MKLILFLFFIAFFSHAQKNSIDNLFEKYYAIEAQDPQKGLELMKLAYDKSVETQNDSLIARSAVNISKKLHELKQIDSAKKYALIANKKALEINFFKIISLSYNLLGLIDKDKNNLNSSLNYYLKGIKIAEDHNEFYALSFLYSNIAYLHDIQGNKEKAKNYYLLNLNLAIKLKDNYLQYLTNESIGGFYSKFDKARAGRYLVEALNQAIILNDEHLTFNSHINLSHLYINKKNFQKEKAHHHLTQAETIANNLNDSIKQFYAFFNWGGYYMNDNNFENALNNYNQALKLLNKDIPLEQHIALYDALKLIHVKTSNFEKAHFYNEKHHHLKDSLFSLEQKKQFETIQTQYEVEKKNNKILNLTLKNEVETKNKWLIFWGSLVLVLVILLLFLRYYFKAKNEQLLSEQEKFKLIKEKELEHIKGEIEGINKERNRISKDLHDGILNNLLVIKQLATNETPNPHKVDEMINQTYQEVRNISHELSSNYLLDKNLDNLINDLLKNFDSSQTQTDLIIYPDKILENLSVNVKEQIYRIIQELLQNIKKHAKASYVSINITKIENELNLIIEDNGIGFDLNSKISGIGLNNVKERLKILDGKIDIDSNSNGTTIIIICNIL